MKKAAKLSAFCCALLLTGCGSSAALTEQAAAPDVQEQKVLEAGKIIDYAPGAETLEDLCREADIILELTVSSAEYAVKNDQLYTIVTPEVMAVYKGDYQGEQIAALGGEMNLGEYYRALSPEEKTFFAPPPEYDFSETLYRDQPDGCPLVRSGDRYLFFGKTAQTEDYAGMYLPLYTRQGFFACDDTAVWLDADMPDWQLREKLEAQFSAGESDTAGNTALRREALLESIAAV